jgi:YesN/AraC family two-component response regulator
MRRIFVAYDEVVTAVNGAEGLSSALSDPPDLVIMDAFMPGKNGRGA